MLIPPFSLKTSNFCSPQNWEEWEGMNLGLMKFLLKSLKYPFNINLFFFSFSRKKNKAIILAQYCPSSTKWSCCRWCFFIFYFFAAIFRYCSNQVCLSFSFSFRLFASLFFILFFINFYELFASDSWEWYIVFLYT